MGRKSLSLFILCAILLSQEILALSESEKLSRPDEKKLVKIEDIPYFVNIEKNASTQCGGAILSPTIVITAAICFLKYNVSYSILSGSSNLHNGTRHEIVKKIINPKFDKDTLTNNLALLVVSPPFDLVDSPNREIPLYNGKLSSNASGISSAWQCNELITYKEIELESITESIVSSDECRRAYPGVAISNKEFCTNNKNGQKGLCNGDLGGPFVVDGKLLGLVSWSALSEKGENPSVVVNLTSPEYAGWISSNLQG